MNSESALSEILTIAELDALTEHYGGRALYVPKRQSTELINALADVVGRRGADALVQWAHGSQVYVPRDASRDIDRRRCELQILRASGMGINKIADTYKFIGRYSARQVARLLEEPSHGRN